VVGLLTQADACRSDGARLRGVTIETLQVTGIRCERCVMRLGKALEGHDGLESANANLMGQVMLSYDEERTTLDALLEKMNRAGFRSVQSPS
jgi:copper chaperone CopZ